VATAREVLAQLKAGDEVSLRDTDLSRDPGVDLVHEWLRDNAPAYRDASGLVYFSRYADIVSAERNAELYTSVNGTVPFVDATADTSMINLDDPHHAAQRRLVVRRFTPPGVRSHADHIRDIARDCVSGFAGSGRCDLVQDLAGVLPAKIICELMGFPPHRWPDCERWARETLGGANFLWEDSRAPDFIGAFGDFCTEVLMLIPEKRTNPGDDLISLWCQTELNGVPMTDDEILAEAILLLDGGAETTRNVIAFGMLELLKHPDQLQLILDDPALLERSAVEELIRWVTPVRMMRRTVTKEHAVHGTRLSPGDQITLLYGSGNRDPRNVDRPDVLDLTRSSNHHLAFGSGTHYCVGANLARFEIRVAFEELFRQCADIRLDPDFDVQLPPQFGGMFTRGLESLPLLFTPSTNRPETI
jgi:cholest-4-en-3-one 26-monooxygenase